MQVDPELILETKIIIHGQKYTRSYEHNNIDNISKNRKQYSCDSRDSREKDSNDRQLGKPRCSRCLGQARSRQSSPANESICNICLKKGHWANACRSQPTVTNNYATNK